MTGKEKRDEIIILRVSPADKERIRLKMDELGVQNMSAFIRKMALDGYCVNLDLTDVKELVHLLRQCSNNLNQYTKKAHQTGSIYEEDIQDLQERFETFWQIGKNLLARLSTIQ
ncbi:MAG: plasmid mobilization relaxosome protein MobC [Lachnospiraceae bacterium]|jgi:hypothetical protein|nr:plasmid mobilization relaxosome protein MobC [Parasporobacterium sp.]MCI6637221.1 plasmid mobilization relaxosome protein MobC [Lachnospiraceae bacterium]